MFVTALRAIADGQWQACVDGIRDFTQQTRVTSATTLRVAFGCIRERAKAARQPLSDDYWRVLHAWATRAIDEAHYKPTGLSDVRTSLLEASEALDKGGHPQWGSDVRQQLATFESSKP